MAVGTTHRNDCDDTSMEDISRSKQIRRKIIANIFRLVVGLIALLALLSISFSLSLKHRSDREHSVQIGACGRANEKQVSENKSQLADYLFFSVTAKLILASDKHPAQPQSRSQEKETKDFAKKLFSYAEAKEWRHLVENCHDAIDEPGYKFHPGVKFLTTIHLREKARPHHLVAIPIINLPPKGALEIQHGE